MQQEMIERVTKAIYDNHPDITSKEEAKALAKTAIKAMKEPTEDMVNAALLHHISCEKNRTPWNGRLMYKVMIIKALECNTK